MTHNSTTEPDLPTVIMQPEARYQPFPLTDIQHAYWVGSTTLLELGGVGVHYYIELECECLDPARLNDSLNRLIARHDMLRAVTLSDGQQQIMQQVPVYQIVTADCQDDRQAAQDQRMAWRAVLSHQHLPTDQWPHFDIRAVLCPEQKSVLHVSLNLLALDLRSLQILFREWLVWYQDSTRVLPALNLSFRDYRLTEQQIEETALYARSRAYWLNRLEDLPSAPVLPLIQSSATLQTSRFKRHQLQLASPQWRQFKARAAQAGVTPTSVLLAVFARILASWGRSSMFTLNLTLFQRQPLHPQADQIIGDFTTLNLLAVDTRSVTTVNALAEQIQRQLCQDLDHRCFSGVQVLRELARRYGPTSMPVVFTSTLGLAEEGGMRPQFGNATYQITQTPQVILDCIVAEEDGNLLLSWDVVAELFPSGLIEAMFAAHSALLTRLAEDEACWHDSVLTLLPTAQITQRAAMNATDQVLVAPDAPGLLHTLFLQQAAVSADQPAVIAPQRTLTYAVLAGKAAQIAAWLRLREARPNTLVAVVMDKGWEQVVAALGIQMAGAAYLPVNPELPTERRHYLFEQGEVQTVLTQSVLDKSIDWPENGITRLCVDTLPDTAAAIQIEPYQCLNKPTDIAYVIYTSGSTGQPKGVVIDHRGAVNTILDINQRFGVTAADRVMGVSALNFDLSVYDIFGPLIAGGAVVLPEPEPEQRIDPAHWCDLMARHQVTVWNTVPALVQMLIDYQQDRAARGALRLVMMSGDWIPLSLPERIRALYPQAAIYSLGGATEASIWSICYPIDRVDPAWNSVPYGKPLANQTFQVLDDQMQPRPVWVPGDLYIGGIGLALGYWRDETKTAAHFITHPDTGERLYKTGDLGRYLPDGNLEFLGRTDFQVKIRGHRIELGEIETTLRQHDSVKDVVVRAVGDTKETNKRLVAYVIYQETQTADQGTAGHNVPDQYTEMSPAGVLDDPIARMEFKLSQPSVKACVADKLITMPRPIRDDALQHAYLARQSYRQFSDEAIALEPFSYLLGSLCQLTVDQAPLPKYRYPSAGSLYPVQTYLHIKSERIQGLAEGFYYYHPAQHKLEPCDQPEAIPPQVAETNQSIFAQAAFAIFLVAESAAIEPMYGDLAHNFCLLEAGYMSQLLMMQAPEQQIGLCPIGGLHEASLAASLGLSGSHVLLHSLAGGQIQPKQMTQWLQSPRVVAAEAYKNQLNTFLQEKLPWYMVPAHYVGLTEFPLSANGKIDYQSLPIPELDDLQDRTTCLAPRTPTEEQVASIWCEVLGCQTPSVDQDFFELGGDSLLATQVLARLRQAFSVELVLRTLFTSPTIAELSHIIEEQILAAVDPALLQAAMAEE